jgi:hypothetical protein
MGNLKFGEVDCMGAENLCGVNEITGFLLFITVYYYQGKFVSHESSGDVVSLTAK